MLTTTLPFEYEIVRAKRKTVAIHVQNGSVQVRAPLRVSKQWINEFVCSQTNWILKRLHKEAHEHRSQIELIDGATIDYLGSTISLSINLSKKTRTYFSDNILTLEVKSLDPIKIKVAFIEWLKKQATEHMIPRCFTLATQLGLQHKITAVRFRVTRTSWGHCSNKGIIQFNPLILLMAPEVVDYLIAHEVGHLQYMNHSKQYWDLVASICPHYQRYKKQLRSTHHHFTH